MTNNFLLFRLRNLFARLFFRFFLAPFLRGCGQASVIVWPNGIEGIGNISIGNNVFIANASLLAAVPLADLSQPQLVIGDKCSLGRNNHIYATRSIVLEEGVLTAGNVYISDNSHSFDDPYTPVREQHIKQLREVRIGAGSWLGQNVCVIGANVGIGCVIGANSVVLSDVPDHCVAVGIPARVVRRYDTTLKIWKEISAGKSAGPLGN